MRTIALVIAIVTAVTAPPPVGAQDAAPPTPGQAGVEPGPAQTASESERLPEPERSPEEKMRARFPQPVLVADMIGMRMLDQDLRVLGRVTTVVRTGEKIEVVVTYRAILGWGGHPVALPLEAVAMLGPQMMLLDLPGSYLDSAPIWSDAGSTAIDVRETIAVALTSR